MTTDGDFSRLLRHHRSRAGQTQQQLADLAAMSIRAVRDLELGRVRRPRRDTVRLLAEALRLTGTSRSEFEDAAGQPATVGDLKEVYQGLESPPPAPLDSLIGREAEAAVLVDLLSSGCQRLVTLTGLTGVGKTRLALEVAGSLHSSSGLAVLWTSTSDLAGPQGALLHAGRLSALIRDGLEALSGRSDDSALDQLTTVIGERPTLLVLDGYQAPRLSADRIVPLLEACAGVRTLITSPLPFALRGERTFPLMPLPVPDPDAEYPARGLEEWASVALMLRHVRRVAPHFHLHDGNAQAVAELCRRLDGIPVALVAVASWFLVYEPETLIEYVRADPFAFAARAADRGAEMRLREWLCASIASLEPRSAALLSHLVDAERSWSVAEAARFAEMGEADCAALVHDLLGLGLIRCLAEDRTRFRVLDLVRFLHATAAPSPIHESGGVPRAAAARTLTKAS